MHRKGRGRAIATLAALGTALLALAGCSVGAYPVDFLQEMHYSPSVRLQEPPRLSRPASAVAFAGAPGGAEAEVAIVPATDAASPAWDALSRAQLEAVRQNPWHDSPQLRQEGALLFQRNCAVCHGAQGDGKGSPIVVASFTAAGATPPAELRGPTTSARTDGALFAIVTYGQGTVPIPADAKDPNAYKSLTNMPLFRKLLTTDQRWALVRHIRVLQGQ